MKVSDAGHALPPLIEFGHIDRKERIEFASQQSSVSLCRRDPMQLLVGFPGARAFNSGFLPTDQAQPRRAPDSHAKAPSPRSLMARVARIVL